MPRETPQGGKYVMETETWRKPNDDGTATYYYRGDHVYLTGREATRLGEGPRPAVVPYDEKIHGEWDPANEDPNAQKSEARQSTDQGSKSR